MIGLYWEIGCQVVADRRGNGGAGSAKMRRKRFKGNDNR